MLASCGQAVEKQVVKNTTPIIDQKIVEEAKKVMEEKVIEEKVIEEKVIEEKVIEEKVMEEKVIEEKVMEEKVMEEKAMEEKVMTKNVWTYQDYSETALKEAKGNNILYFSASWCPSCVAAEKKLQAEELPEGINVFKVDFDSATELRKKYWVTTKHTFVLLDENMEKVKMDVWTIQNAKDLQKAFVSDDTAMVKEEVMKKEESVPAAPVVAAWSYSEYSEAAVKSATGNKVLFFAASWCPSCVSADKTMKSETIPEGLNVFKVDYDSNVDLRKKYGVTGQHTFVLVNDNMEKVKLMVGGRNSADIVKGLLN